MRNDAMAPWSLEAIRTRIAARCKELSSEAATLLRRKGYKIGLVADLRRDTRRSVELRTLEQIADALDWTLPDLLGVETTQLNDIDRELLRGALLISDQVIGNRTAALTREERVELLADVITAAYRFVAVAMSQGGELKPATLQQITRELYRIMAMEARRHNDRPT